MIMRVVVSPLQPDRIRRAQLADGARVQEAVDDVAFEDADGLVADDARAADVVELDAPAVGRDDDQQFRGRARSALMLSRRGMNFGGVLGRSFGRGLTSICTRSASRAAHRDAPDEQRPEIHARLAILDAHVRELVIDVDASRAEAAGNRAAHVLDLAA